MSENDVGAEHSEEYIHKRELVEAMTNLSSKEKEITSSQNFGKAYVLSILFPPVGIYYFVKYLFFAGGDNEHVKAGVISLILTLVSLFVSLWSLYALFSQATSSLPIQDMQSFKDLVSPESQKQILNLYK